LRGIAPFAASALIFIASPSSPVEREPEPTFMVVDLHVDVPWQVHVKHRDKRLGEGMASAEALRRAPYAAIVLPIYLPDKAHPDGAHLEDAEATFTTIQSILDDSPLFLPLLGGRAEPGRITTFLAIEGAGAFAEDITAIDRFIARGLRLVSPCHASNTKLASSATGKKAKFGLTDLGKQFCDRVYAGGALVDVSHVSDAAFDDIAVIARKHGAPIVATHSNARVLGKSPRDLTDAQLRAIGESGGVAGLNFHAPFVTGEHDATLDDLVRQTEYMVSIAGIDHVAIGSDYDGGIRPVEGLEDASKLPTFAAALRRRGMRDADILKIFALNALRVLAWRAPGASPSSASAMSPKPMVEGTRSE